MHISKQARVRCVVSLSFPRSLYRIRGELGFPSVMVGLVACARRLIWRVVATVSAWLERLVLFGLSGLVALLALFVLVLLFVLGTLKAEEASGERRSATVGRWGEWGRCVRVMRLRGLMAAICGGLLCWRDGGGRRCGSGAVRGAGRGAERGPVEGMWCEWGVLS